MVNDNMVVFASRLRRLVWEFKSFRGFEKAVGVTHAALKNWMLLRGFPRAEIIIDICRERHVSSDWLLGLSDDPGRELVVWGES